MSCCSRSRPSQSGTESSLNWVYAELSKKILLKREGILGSARGDSKEIRVLNRVIRYTDAGICYEADPRHVEILPEQLKLDDSKKADKPQIIPRSTSKKRLF